MKNILIAKVAYHQTTLRMPTVVRVPPKEERCASLLVALFISRPVCRKAAWHFTDRRNVNEHETLRSSRFMPFGILNPEIFGLSANLHSPASSFYRFSTMATGVFLWK
jgi:hypothetical protein